ncbi:glutamate--cysteine ligase [Frigoribacterium sp. VKM Ac-2530]|uniref:carboxylate-amine ligase n=1 Tax=Frigoribacterium sp. VKM Ac-2530 TaxID=2783822 RepID=UPI00188B6C9E|nr:glutamate--cysteine ligase [Frigoribacterium sp. VKM Ac-2530]MBF4579139.1 glutamate--cysteine ligase [Frigoribacterium sp. VKM Ac-2530]
MTTFGIEEEFILVDPVTLTPADVAASVHAELLGSAHESKFVSHEFLASQIERSSPVFTQMDQAEADLVTFRTRLAAQARSRGVVAAAVGTPFMCSGWPAVTDTERYHRVEEEFRGLVTDHLINGTHVHVGVRSRDVGVAVLNRVRTWLPTLLALTGNSPYWHGADTGFASWRAMHMRRWSTGGCPPPFADAADYDRRIRRLVGVGGTYDTRTIWWNARLAEDHPTVEVRVADAQLDTGGALLAATLVRALVDTARAEAEADVAPLEVEPELLDAGLWHAARDGLGGELLDPVAGELRGSREVLHRLLVHVGDALDASGDHERTRALLDRVTTEGTGAERQRAAVRRGGPAELRRLCETALVARA